jgi:hypothetical protein
MSAVLRNGHRIFQADHDRAEFMRTRGLIFLSGLFLALTSVSVLADSRHCVLWGVGNDSCGKLVQEQAQRSQRFELQLSWIAGFVSAGNGELASMMAKKNIKSDLLKGTNPRHAYCWSEYRTLG